MRFTPARITAASALLLALALAGAPALIAQEEPAAEPAAAAATARPQEA